MANQTDDQCRYCGYKDGKHNDVCVAAENARLRKALGAIAVDALQKNWDGVLEWARGAHIELPNGEPEVSL